MIGGRSALECAPPAMPTTFIGDPTRLSLWLSLHRVGGAIRSVRLWRARDGGDAQTLRGHQHVVPTLVLCLQGVARVIGARTCDLRPGEALAIAPGCWHEHVALRPGSLVFSLGFMAARCDIMLADHRESSWGTVKEQPFRLWMDRIMAGSDAEAARAGVASICAQIFAERASPVHWLHPAVQRMATTLWWRLHTPITAADIVRAAAVGPDGIGHSRAYELFTAFFGATPKQELLRQRLALARQLLDEGAAISEAAARSGFTARASFTRAWRRAHGAPPSVRSARAT
jgi:hypothetical protein